MGFPIGSALSCERPFGIFDSSLFFFASVGREGEGKAQHGRGFFPFPIPFFCLFVFVFFWYGYGTQNSVGRSAA